MRRVQQRLRKQAEAVNGVVAFGGLLRLLAYRMPVVFGIARRR